uniref:Uncharacterized protein n=1 Tax=Romanomermis culicivorax TaxID=13658 RepID=A0A915JDP0_ROMCU
MIASPTKKRHIQIPFQATQLWRELLLRVVSKELVVDFSNLRDRIQLTPLSHSTTVLRTQSTIPFVATASATDACRVAFEVDGIEMRNRTVADRFAGFAFEIFAIATFRERIASPISGNITADDREIGIFSHKACCHLGQKSV